MEIEFLQCKNKYGYVKRQLRIDYYNKTYKVGIFKIGADKTVANKFINEKIEELKLLGFKEEILYV